MEVYDYHGRGHRTGLRCRFASGDRKSQKLEIVRGKEYSANQTCLAVYAPPVVRSPDAPQPRAKGRPSSPAPTKGPAGWGLFGNDPEVKRRRRVASYKAYAVEGKVKASVRRGFRWIKGKCTGLVGGW